jgi:integration host factor subunit alpha
MGALTKDELSAKLFDEMGLNKREAREIVDLFFDTIKEELAKGRRVKIPGFGNFILHNKSERQARNPKTGVEAVVSARRVTTFHAGQKLKEKVEQYAGSEIKK